MFTSIHLRVIPVNPKHGLLPVLEPKLGKAVTTFDLYILNSGGFEFWVQKSCKNSGYRKTWTAFWLSIAGQSSARWTSHRSRYIHLIDEYLPWFCLMQWEVWFFWLFRREFDEGDLI